MAGILAWHADICTVLWPNYTAWWMPACGLDADYKSCDLLQDWLHLWKAARGGRLPSLVSFILTLFQIQSFSSRTVEMPKSHMVCHGVMLSGSFSLRGIQSILSPNSLYRKAAAEIKFCFQRLWDQCFRVHKAVCGASSDGGHSIPSLARVFPNSQDLLLQSQPPVSPTCLGEGAVPY